jgi:signal transduction histidine kinase/methyl-accepting chemotaxis protein
MKNVFSSIRVRLLLCFTLVSSFSIIVALLASFSFNEVGKDLQLITTQRMPAAVFAGEMARAVESIVANTPALLNARNEGEKSLVRQQLDIELEELKRLLSSLRNTLDAREYDSISPAIMTLQQNLIKLDAAVGKTLQLAKQKDSLLRQLEKDYNSFERTIAPRLLRANARLLQLQNAGLKKQSVDIDELLEVTRSVQPLQQLRQEVQTLRDGLIKIAYETEQNNFQLLEFPLQRSQDRGQTLLNQLSGDDAKALKPRLDALSLYLSGDQAIIKQRSWELEAIAHGRIFFEENILLSQRLTKAVGQLVDAALVDINEANNQALKVQRDSQVFMLGVVLLAILCSILIVWLYVDRRIVRRLKLLSDNMSSIAGGDLQHRIVDPGHDEIAQMADALEVFRETAIDVEQSNLLEVKQARAQLRDAIDTISEGFCLFDKDDRLVLQNNKYRQMFGLKEIHIGWSFESLLKKALASRIEAKENVDAYFIERLKHHQNPPGPFIQKLQDGTWLRITERKTENQGTVAIYSDITEIKQREQARDLAIIERDKSLYDLEAVMNTIDYGILFLDKDLNITSCNHAYNQIWEMRSEDIDTARTFRDTFSLAYDDVIVGTEHLTPDEYADERIAEVKKGSVAPYEIKTQKGRTILARCVALADDSRMLTFFDITELKRAELELRQSEERYSLALDGANEALWEWETGSAEIYISHRFHEIADWPAGQEGISRDQWLALVHVQDRERIREALIQHMRGGNDYFDVEYRLLGPEKVYRWVRHRGAGLRREDGWIYRMAGSVGDIEARKQFEFTLRDAKEIAEQNSRFKSQFIANMSHELRTPLNAIIGITEMLREDVVEDGPEAFGEPLTRVSRAGKHLLNLINDVLDLSRIEAGKLALYPEHIEIETVLNDAVITTQHLVQQNSNTIHLDVAEEVKSIYSDPLRFRQIVLNLLSNALKFTQNGDIHLRAASETREDGDWLRLEVSDTGIGIEAAFLDRLFLEFAQEDSSATRKFGGTGLGLTISQRLCSMMGGVISVESTVGIGTIFTVRLPAIASRYSESELLANQARIR